MYAVVTRFNNLRHLLSDLSPTTKLAIAGTIILVGGVTVPYFVTQKLWQSKKSSDGRLLFIYKRLKSLQIVFYFILFYFTFTFILFIILFYLTLQLTLTLYIHFIL